MYFRESCHSVFICHDGSWKDNKRMLSGVAAVILLGVSAVAFSTGLSFGGEWGWLVAPATWIALTVIQLVGNDMENHTDWIFTIGWLFTYILGVGATTWAMYTWVIIPNEFIRWMISLGLGGAIEILPERLIVLFLKSAGKIMRQPNARTEPYSPQKSAYQPLHRPSAPAASPASFKPKSGGFQSAQPTYQNQGRPTPPRDYEEPRF